jgi:hypothetical protein
MKKGLLILSCICTAVFLFSCKRSDVFGDIETNTDRVIAGFTDAGTGTYVSCDFSANAIEVDLTELRLDLRSVINHPTKVRVIPNPVVVDNYNAANGTAYIAAPAAAFSLTPNEYVLKPAQRKAMIRAALRPSAFLDRQYAVGLSIAEMSDGEISPIAHDVIVFISIKNDYDGIYNLKGYSNIPATPYIGNFTIDCSEELEVATSGVNSVYLAPAQPVYDNGTFAYISNLLPDLVFDKATSKVTAVNARAGSLGFIFPYDVSYNSRYDQATKTIYVKYGIVPVGSGRYIIDTLTYCRPR